MLETWIEIDKEKIRREGIYVPEFFENEVRKLFIKAHFEEVSPGYYVLDDEKYSSIESLGIVVLTINRAKTAAKYITKWIIYDEEDGKEDILEKCFNKNHAKVPS